MNSPKISIIMPTYNVEKYFKQCLESVINQTLKDIEIIPIDDGCTDNCGAIMDEYAKKDSRIKPIHQENGGYGLACNMGLEKATGEYIAIVEPDDYIDSSMYENLYNLALKHDAQIVKSCFYENFDCKDYKKIKKALWDKKHTLPKTVFNINEYPVFFSFHPSVWSCIYKRDFLNKHNIKFVEAPGAGWTDNLFQVQTMCLAQRIFYTNNAYYYWRRAALTGSDELKDYTIPFKRSDEIHKWLEENSINDKNILACLYKRELAYISTVFGMKKIENIWDCFAQVKAMCSRMPAQLIFNSKEIKAKDKRFYWQCKYMPLLLYLLTNLKQFRKNLISIRFNEREKLIRLFGKLLYYKVTDEKKLEDANTIYYNLCFSSNERYAQHLCCALKSIFFNKKYNEEFNIFILDDNIKKSTKKYIKSIISKNSKVQFIPIQDKLFKNCPLTKETSHINSLTTYYRFILPGICNEDKILYLDCDIIVNSSLSDLYSTDIDDCYIAGVEDLYVEANCKRLNLNKYVNAGVLLINLSLWRKDKIQEKLFDWCSNNKDKIVWVDQDVLNVVLQNKILYLPHIYNAQVSELEFGKTAYFNKIANEAFIIHYVGGKKPWQLSDFTLNKYYFKYFNLLPWRFSWVIKHYLTHIKRVKKLIFRLKISRKEFYLILFGKTLLGEKK